LGALEHPLLNRLPLAVNRSGLGCQGVECLFDNLGFRVNPSGHGCQGVEYLFDSKFIAEHSFLKMVLWCSGSIRPGNSKRITKSLKGSSLLAVPCAGTIPPRQSSTIAEDTTSAIVLSVSSPGESFSVLNFSVSVWCLQLGRVVR
jgi:hypothetical protein